MRNDFAAIGISILIFLLVVFTRTQAENHTSIARVSTPHEQNQLFNAHSLLRQPITSTLKLEDIEQWIGIPVELSKIHNSKNTSAKYLLISDTNYQWFEGEWVGKTRTTNTYNHRGQKNSVLNDTCHEGLWSHSDRTLWDYDSNGLLLTYTSQSWQLGDWVNSSVIDFTYDITGVLTQYFMQTWSGTAWVNSSRGTLTYSSGHIESYRLESWDSGSSTWINSVQFVYTYDGPNLIQYLVLYWQSNAWVNNIQVISTFDSNGDEFQRVVQSWQGSVWVNNSKNDRTFESAHHKVLDIYSLWMSSAWQSWEADTFKYSNNLLSEDVHVGNMGGGIKRTQYTYDVHDNEILQLYQIWDYNDSTWVNSSKTVKVYSSGICGDEDGSGDVDIADAVYLINYIFGGGPLPVDSRQGDIDCDLEISIADAVYLVNYIFSGGAVPCAACS
jgi:hypothetical protein